MATMTTTTQATQVINFIGAINKGTFGTTLATLTIPTMNKKGNPFYGRVQKATLYENIALGYGYENTINNRLAREGKESNFDSRKPFGRSWVKGFENLLLCSDKNPTQYYLRTTRLPNTYIKEVYFIDGRGATPSELADLQTWLKTPNTPTNQGLNDGNEVIVRDYKVDGIIAIKQGDKVFNTMPFEIQEIRAFFK